MIKKCLICDSLMLVFTCTQAKRKAATAYDTQSKSHEICSEWRATLNFGPYISFAWWTHYRLRFWSIRDWMSLLNNDSCCWCTGMSWGFFVNLLFILKLAGILRNFKAWHLRNEIINDHKLLLLNSQTPLHNGHSTHFLEK